MATEVRTTGAPTHLGSGDRLIISDSSRDVLACAASQFSPAPGSGGAEYARLSRELGERMARIFLRKGGE
jgi:hypothetical protein